MIIKLTHNLGNFSLIKTIIESYFPILARIIEQLLSTLNNFIN